jgi:formylglycine-generating enzyme required for sulfatase activity
MQSQGRASVALLIVLAIGVTACGNKESPQPSGPAASAATVPPSTTATTEPSSQATGATSGSASPSSAQRGQVTIPVAIVGDPGNPSVGVWQVFKTVGATGAGVTLPPAGTTGIYPNCEAAPSTAPSCLTVGAVKDTFGIGEFEITVDQYVTFLNTVDPDGQNLRQLYEDHMNSTVWPEYGPIAFSSGSGAGQHYSVAYPEWAQKPFNFGDFRRGARFVNSLYNGTILSKTPSTSGAFKYTTYQVRLSPETEKGMYDMTQEAPTRSASTGFVLPSNDEWIKAAYYDPNHGGTDSYWLYPTGPFDQPNVAVLDPSTGDVTNASTQPLANYNPNDPNSTVDTPGAPAGTAPTWCPPEAGPSCATTLPPDFPPGLDLQKLFMGNVSTVGQAKTPSPWGAYDMGGNVVEHTDSVAPQPPGYDFVRDWRYYHGGVSNAPAYQVAIYGFGYFPGDPQLGRIYPWMGFRVGIVGDIGNPQ